MRIVSQVVAYTAPLTVVVPLLRKRLAEIERDAESIDPDDQAYIGVGETAGDSAIRITVKVTSRKPNPPGWQYSLEPGIDQDHLGPLDP